LCDAIQGTNVSFNGGVWEVRLTEDGKVFNHVGKYDIMGTEVVPKTKVLAEESKASISRPTQKTG